MSNVGERIRELRIKKKLSLQQMADLIGYSHKSSINRIEQGRVGIPIKKVPAFAKALDTTEAYLLGAIDDPSPTARNQQYIVSNTFDEYLSEASANGYSELFRIFAEMVDKYGIDRASNLICGYMNMSDAHRAIIDELIKTYSEQDSPSVW